MKRRLCWITLVSLILVGLGSSPPAQATPSVEQTRVFQQGLDGYSGAGDTWVSTQDWGDPDQYSVNYGQNEVLNLSRDGGNNPLLRFDLTAVPTNSQVISATLSLYNTTPGECDADGSAPRYVALHQVSRSWDEGNQMDSPIDSPGDHGATGDYAVQYYTGQGTDVAWGERGMQAGSDYAAAAEGNVGVVNAGWYTWDVSELVSAWVHGDTPNDGVTLRDLSGYAVNNCDWRDFVSSQGANASQRPKLSVVYNPDTPYADAGPDRVNLEWDGNAVTLDGSASHDRPGGNDASLSYAWRIAKAGYGSTLPTLIGTGETLAFTPDVAGEWEIDLTVTNDVDEIAVDRVHLRLLDIAAHPRIYLTPQKLAALQARAVAGNPRWAEVLESADYDGDMMAQALVSQVTGQASYCQSAIDNAIAATGEDLGASDAGDIALVYDWCYAHLTAGQITTLVTFFNTWGDDQLANPGYTDTPGLGNYWPRFGYSFALVGLASYGDNPRAQEWMDEYRVRRFRDIDLPWLNKIAAGGGWPEGMIYDWIANMWRVEAVEAWRTATGESLYEATAWFQERLGYVLLHRWPGVVLASYSDVYYHPYVSTGDTERNRGSMANYERIMALILIEHYATHPQARQLQAYMATSSSLDFLASREFTWFNPDQPSAPPTPRTHYAAGIGSVFMRAGWPDGAADTDPGVTYLTFQTGDHFTYHQHYDQNSFTIFKHDDLALDSGVYSGDGRSYHDRNYYVRTIAHNTLIVYNPNEEFPDARPDAESNDGGQRTMSPGSRGPQTVEEFERDNVQYETGSILHFDDAGEYTYVLGDATAAYNNPTYNQAMNTSMSNNVAKVSRFQREFVYLRPETSATGALLDDYVVLYDRVGVTSADFSGQNTKLMFHVMNAPAIGGGSSVVLPGETLYINPTLATAVNGNGKLFIRPLLPEQRNVRLVGGRGQRAFWAFGENYDWHWAADEPQPRPTNDFEDVPYGEWRLELEPSDTALDHNFLTVLQPTISTTAAVAPMAVINTDKLEGVLIADPALNRVALFSAAGDGLPPSGTLQYTYHPLTNTLNLIFDLKPGASYVLTASLDSGIQTVTLTPGSSGELVYQVNDQGVLRFLIEASGGLVEWPKVYLPLILRG